MNAKGSYYFHHVVPPFPPDPVIDRLSGAEVRGRWCVYGGSTGGGGEVGGRWVMEFAAPLLMVSVLFPDLDVRRERLA